MNTKYLHNGMIVTIIGFLLIYFDYIEKRSPFDHAGFVGVLLALPIATFSVAFSASAPKNLFAQSFTAGMCGVRLAAYAYVLFVYGRLLLNIQTNERWIICVVTGVCLVMVFASLNRLKSK